MKINLHNGQLYDDNNKLLCSRIFSGELSAALWLINKFGFIVNRTRNNTWEVDQKSYKEQQIERHFEKGFRQGQIEKALRS